MGRNVNIVSNTIRLASTISLQKPIENEAYKSISTLRYQSNICTLSCNILLFFELGPSPETLIAKLSTNGSSAKSTLAFEADYKLKMVSQKAGTVTQLHNLSSSP